MGELKCVLSYFVNLKYGSKDKQDILFSPLLLFNVYIFMRKLSWEMSHIAF